MASAVVNGHLHNHTFVRLQLTLLAHKRRERLTDGIGADYDREIEPGWTGLGMYAYDEAQGDAWVTGECFIAFAPFSEYRRQDWINEQSRALPAT
jgi:hypothetical protein